MANAAWQSRMFVVFHLALGVVLLYASGMTVLRDGSGNMHVRLMAGIEAVGAVLFLLPKTVRTGAWVLLLVIVVAFVFHSSLGEWRGDLIVYAAGVALIAAHGPTYGGGRQS
ncbi:MAG TPA: hypothetical protein VMM80_10065 [Bacteroidota bacterium]|nr:hypothetical protein [Bacteroidota bacterium]